MMRWLHRTFGIAHGGPTLAPMEGLRGLAVFLVFLVHYSSLSAPWLREGSATAALAGQLHAAGNIGVDLFFVLSGYLIYGTLLRRPVPFPAYLRRRVERIYPTFLVVFAIYLLLAAVAPGEKALPAAWPARIAYIGANALLLPGLFPIKPIITVAWSLSYEFFYYLIVPAAIALLSLRGWTPANRIKLAVAVAVGAFVAGWWQAAHLRLVMFVAGILVYELTTGKEPLRVPRFAGPLALVLALVGMIAMERAALSGWSQCLLLFTCFLVLSLDAFSPTGSSVRALSAPLLRAFGNMSYSYYLIHGLALRVLFGALPRLTRPDHNSDGLFWVLFLPAFFFTLVPAVVLFVTVEKPWSLTRRSSPKAAAAPALAASVAVSPTVQAF